MKNKLPAIIIVILSVLVPMLVGFLLFSSTKINSGGWAKILPHLNAVINSLTVIILLCGYYFIRHGNIQMHKACMTSAFILGTIFLISYIIYHSSVPSTSYGNDGAIKIVYLSVLLSHILLSVIVVPFVLFAFFFALSDKIAKHKKVVRFTLPIWLYVSISGVLVYLMISPFYT